MRRENGFVLLLVLATLVVLSLLAAAIAANVERAVADQARANADFQARLDTESTRATLLYLASSRRQTFGGQTIDDAVMSPDGTVADWRPGSDVPSYTPLGNELRLDGSVYRGLGSALFAVQDERGKISINFSDRRMLERRFPAFAAKHWGCSLNDVPWSQFGCRGAKLDYLLSTHYHIDHIGGLQELVLRCRQHAIGQG